MNDPVVGRIEQLTHTPGPWRWMDDTALVGDHGRRPVVLTGGAAHGSLLTRGEDGRLRDLKADEPNAVLMAAAPDLLAALKRAVETIRAFHDMGTYSRSKADDDAAWALYQQSPEMQAINAAIAKAEGRS